jgi:phosphoglucosamine mutase
VGRIRRFSDAEDRYIIHLLGSLDVRLDGLHVVIDAAHGAAAAVSPQAFTDAGARVTVIGNDPDGMNINDGVGSTHLGPLRAAVVEHGADLGIAHDGDADRCLAIDAAGEIVDGDRMMAILATSLKARGMLKDDTLVATVMSNLGLRVAMAEHGIRMIETQVGDRYVLEVLNEQQLSLGGEQSGHIIFTTHATTGDGILTGLQLAAEIKRTGKTLAELASVMTVYPQVLVNVRDVDHHGLESDETIAAAVTEAEKRLGDSGRVLLRPSGTEPLVRVMVEAENAAIAQEVSETLAAVVRERLAH